MGKNSLPEGLIEIHPKVYSMSGQPTPTRENLVVAIHPFYTNPYLSHKMSYTSTDSTKNYFERLNHLLSTKEGTIITLEEAKKLQKTLNHFRTIGTIKNRLFIRTKNTEYTTKDMDFSELARYVESLRDGRTVDLIGGYLSEGERS